MPRYRVQKYVTAIHRRKLVKNCGEPSGVLEWRRRRRVRCGIEGYPLSGGGGIWGPENFFDSVLSLEMLNIYAFWTLEQGDNTATVIMMLHQFVFSET